MKKQATAPKPAAVLTMEAIKSLSQTERIAKFADRATVAQRAFSEMGKLMYAISAELKPKQTIYEVLRKVGIKDGTISNASYASKAFEFVTDGLLKESEYDSFTFADCLSIARVTGPKSLKRLAKEDVVVIVREVKDFGRELECLYNHGMTLEEKQNADIEAEKAAATPPAVVPDPAPAAPTSAPAAAPSADTKPAADASTPAPVPAAANAGAADSPPTFVTMPKAKPTGEAALRLLDTVEEMMLELDAEAQVLVARRVIAMAETICSFIEKPAAQPVKKTAKKAA